MATEACGTCGTELQVVETTSPLHKQTYRIVDACKACAEAQEQAEADERRERLVPGYIRESGVKPRWHGASLNQAVWPELSIDSGNAQAIGVLQSWVAGKSSLYVWGGTGSGKTTLAMAALLDCCRACQEGLFLPEMQLEADYHRGWARDMIHRAWEIEVLVLDDIASRELDNRLLTVYRDIFDARSLAGLKTLITGQKSPQELMAHWRLAGGQLREDIASRLRMILGGKAVEVKGSNRRLGGHHVAR